MYFCYPQVQTHAMYELISFYKASVLRGVTEDECAQGESCQLVNGTISL